MQGRKKVYVETSVISNLTARRSLNIIDLARQVATQNWWAGASDCYRLFSSPLVEREALRGDKDASVRRMEILRTLENLPITRDYETCRKNGYECPLICTPEQLVKEVDNGIEI